jgi:hypothetical protein
VPAAKRKTHSKAKTKSTRKAQKRVRQAENGAAGRKSRPASTPDTVTIGLHPRERDLTVIRPSWRRYLQVYETLLQEGAPVTETAIARQLRISRQALWRIHRRNPGMRPWVSSQLAEKNIRTPAGMTIR